jgi:hypothetical protein
MHSTRHLPGSDAGLAGSHAPLARPLQLTRSRADTSTFLALDLGGTNLRVCEVRLLGNHKFEMKQQKYKVSDDLKEGEATVLFGEWGGFGWPASRPGTGQHGQVGGRAANSGLCLAGDR